MPEPFPEEVTEEAKPADPPENAEEPCSVQYEYEYSDSDVINVTFTKDGNTHERIVNNTGDSETFETRVKEVARGVENKITVGVIPFS